MIVAHLVYDDAWFRAGKGDRWEVRAVGALFEDLVAGSVVVIVGGAIVGMVIKLLWGNRGEDRALDNIAAKYADKPKGKKSKGK